MKKIEKASSAAALTDLEAAALGCVFRHQPCTAHFVRMQFRQSPSPRFSDSAGSIYPLMRRLRRQGWVSVETRRDGQRDVEYYQCSASGRRALRRWLGPPLPLSDGITLDPLRTKMIYLAALGAQQRRDWLCQAENVLRDRLNEVEARLAAELDSASPDVYQWLAHENARLEIEARLRWLSLARIRLPK